MNKLNPYLRYIAVTDYLPNKDYVKAYDCRFLFVLSGKGKMLTESDCFLLSENTLAYYPSGISYLLSSSEKEPLSFVTVNFDFTDSYPRCTDLLSPVRCAEFNPQNERPTHKEVTDTHFSKAFAQECALYLRDDFLSLDKLFKKGEIYTEELCSALLRLIVLKIANCFGAEGRENQAVSRVSRYIEQHCSERMDNRTLASRFGYHPYYLSGLFKLHTGKTLHQYILDTRLARGRDMLRHTDLSVAEIAAKCGFQNGNHFSVRFKERYKESPHRWRRLNSII